jgi:putative transposase
MTNYSSDLSSSQWQFIANFLDTDRSRKYNLRTIVNAVLYVVKTGCQWRMLPGDFPNWKIVYYYFSTWNRRGIIEQMQMELVKLSRLSLGKEARPTTAIIDAQSVKNTLVSSESRGFDAGKKIKGMKRHIIVDTLGLILAVVIQSASVQDRTGAVEVIEKLRAQYKKIIVLFADAGYTGKLAAIIKTRWKIRLEIIKRTELHHFAVLPKRWIVERTFAWLDTNRRNSKNYERLNSTSEAMVRLSAIRLMLNRI